MTPPPTSAGLPCACGHSQGAHATGHCIAIDWYGRKRTQAGTVYPCPCRTFDFARHVPSFDMSEPGTPTAGRRTA